MRRSFLLLALLLGLGRTAEAQRVCKTGKPCGNSCIAQNKTCHVGSGSARSAGSTAVPLRTGAPAEPSTDSMPWVGSSRGHTYYIRGCSGANQLAVQNRIYFRTEAEAERAGYQRSRSRGC